MLLAPLMGKSILSMRRSFVRNGSEHFAAAEGNGEQSTVISRGCTVGVPSITNKLMLKPEGLEPEGLEQRFTTVLTL